jgi:hypothetical protein
MLPELPDWLVAPFVFVAAVLAVAFVGVLGFLGLALFVSIGAGLREAARTFAGIVGAAFRRPAG